MWLSPRLKWHTLVVVTLLAAVIAPAFLLILPQLGLAVEVPAVVLLAWVASAVIGAALASTVNRSRCTTSQWYAIVASTLVLNPVAIVALSLWCGWGGMLTWNAMPLGCAILLLLGRMRLGERISWFEPRQHSMLMTVVPWLLSRVLLVMVPAGLVSLQLALYIPRSASIVPGKDGGGLVTWCGCVLMCLKLYTICLAVFHQQLAQGMVLILMQLADWVSFLRWGSIVNPELHMQVLLSLLVLAGLVQLRFALFRLRLFPRWKVALARRRAELSSGASAELQAGIVERRVVDSSDSEDEQGPGSLPEGFYGALGAILGFPQVGSVPSRREWLCGARCARVLSTSSQDDLEAGKDPSESLTTAPASNATSNSSSSSSGATEAPQQVEMAPLEVEAHAKCAICLEDICNGQQLRPLPKCGHKFHSQCLDQWVSMKVAMNQETRCPTCRRPALSRIKDIGAIPISDFENSSRRQHSGSSRSSQSSESRHSRRRAYYHSPRASEEGVYSPEARRGRSVLQRYCTEPAFFQQVSCQYDITPEFQIDDGEVSAYLLEGSSSPFGVPINVVDRGPFFRWNEMHAHQSVCRGDHIMEVDGQSGTSEQLIAALDLGKHRLSIRRYHEFAVKIHRPNGQGRLGLDITHWYYSLQIRNVHNGPIQRWNAAVESDTRVLEGDCIVEVDGVRGTAEQLLQKIHGCLSEQWAEIDFVLVRRRRRAADEGRFESESPPPSEDSEASASADTP
mmetsp:Transcript_60921/g.113049  ORF Transcript_60921/g.113049 Transcript_60921/m.113049 type:complete len:737 (-) Transcript_60921:114-2324(-)